MEMADGVGFEPTKGFHPCRFSRPVLSTAQPPIRLMHILRYKHFRGVSTSMLGTNLGTKLLIVSLIKFILN